MEFDNKTILIIGLIAGGMLSLYLQQENIASAIFGGLVGYLSKDSLDTYLSNKNNDELEDDTDDI